MEHDVTIAPGMCAGPITPLQVGAAYADTAPCTTWADRESVSRQ